MKLLIVLGLSALIATHVLADALANTKKQLDHATAKKDKRTTVSTYGYGGGSGQHGSAGLGYAPTFSGLNFGHFPGVGLSSGFGHGGLSLGGGGLGHALLLQEGHGLSGLNFGGHGLGQPLLLQGSHGFPSYGGISGLSLGGGHATVSAPIAIAPILAQNSAKLGPVTFGIGTGGYSVGSSTPFGHNGGSLSYSSPSISSGYSAQIPLGLSASSGSSSYSSPAVSQSASSLGGYNAPSSTYSAPSTSYSYNAPSTLGTYGSAASYSTPSSSLGSYSSGANYAAPSVSQGSGYSYSAPSSSHDSTSSYTAPSRSQSAYTLAPSSYSSAGSSGHPSIASSYSSGGYSGTSGSYGKEYLQ
ncbi:prisilkin-39-like [Zootermopsis nevadensis]|uniref:Uncharacterized protein n=1 Tax=Zootermopsis nevadensis TaxID=136037 RepID=A0A067RG28_ZOONE|nr:prisilkin-39-like [Zootermopsis nevadensis]KDR22831.1 hypothetical protein L798_13083 [Zootermopsis nevadensis]